MPARPPNHRASTLALATLAAALLPCRVRGASEQGAGEIHVFLRGEDRSYLQALPIRADAPFPWPQWTPEAAIGEIIRAPVGGAPAPATGVAAPTETLAGGTEEAGATADPAPLASAAAELPSPREGAGGEIALPTQAAATPAPPRTSSPGVGTAEAERAQGAGSDRVALGAEIPKAPAAPALSLDSAAPRSGAQISVSYRPGESVVSEGLLELSLPRAAAGIGMHFVAGDDLVPSPLLSASGLAARAHLAGGGGNLGASLEGSIVARQALGSAPSTAAIAGMEARWEPGGFSIRTSTSFVRTRQIGSPALWSGEQEVGARGRLNPWLAVRARLDGALSSGAAWNAAGGLGLEIEHPEKPLRVMLGLVVGTDGGAASALPWAELFAERPGALAVVVDLGPLARHLSGLDRPLLDFDPPDGAPGPEWGATAGARIEITAIPALPIGVDLRWAGGTLWMLRDSAIEIAAGHRVCVAGRVELWLPRAPALALTVGSVAAWAMGETPGLSELTARMEARAGFWVGSVAGIIRQSRSGRPTSVPGRAAWGGAAEALDGESGLQLAASLTRRLLASGSVTAEARLLVREDPRDVVATFRLGGSIGVQ